MRASDDARLGICRLVGPKNPGLMSMDGIRENEGVRLVPSFAWLEIGKKIPGTGVKAHWRGKRDPRL